MLFDMILFDLDDTLYPASSGVWNLIQEKIDLFMINQLGYTNQNVDQARKYFFNVYGTTLRGLEQVHQINSLEYLKYVHNVPIEKHIKPNPKLKQFLEKIDLKKHVFTNGDRWHAERVLNALEISDHFHTVVDILDVTPYCKPMREAFEIAMRKIGCDEAGKILFIDDSIRNIKMANELGFQTIWVNENGNNQDYPGKTIRRIEELPQLLSAREPSRKK